MIVCDIIAAVIHSMRIIRFIVAFCVSHGDKFFSVFVWLRYRVYILMKIAAYQSRGIYECIDIGGIRNPRPYIFTIYDSLRNRYKQLASRLDVFNVSGMPSCSAGDK